MTLEFVSRSAFVLLVMGVLGACSELAYYGQATRGHWEIVNSGQPIDELIVSETTSTELRARLKLSDELRRFAVSVLGLPDNDSYRSYVDLDRPYAVWSVFSAPELSLSAKTWCYPVVGCLSYRGYFDLTEARALAASLREEGQEVWIGGVPAYSSLGWSNDPLLSTFIRWPDGRLAELIFHELAHQEIYLSGDTAFNEAFATAVGQQGAERWLKSRGDVAALAAYRRLRARRLSFMTLTGRYRDDLGAIYTCDLGDHAKRRLKAAVLKRLAVEYDVWKTEEGGFSGFDPVIELGPNNAWFSAMATYHKWVPAFESLLRESGGDFSEFYQRVRRLAAKPASERDRRLEAMGRTAFPSLGDELLNACPVQPCACDPCSDVAARGPADSGA